MNKFYILTIIFLFVEALANIKAQESNSELIIQKIINNISQVKSFKADLEEENINYLNKRKSVITQKTDSNGDIYIRINIKTPFDNSHNNNNFQTNNYIIESNHGIYSVNDASIIKLSQNNESNIKEYFVTDWQIDSIFNESSNLEISNKTIGEKEYLVIARKTPAGIYDNEIKRLGITSNLNIVKTRPSAIAVSEVIYYFDKQSFMPIKKEAFNAGGKLLYSKHISNILTNYEVSDDYFQLPKNRKIEELQENVKKIIKTLNNQNQ